MREEKVKQLAKLIFTAMPAMRRDTLAPARIYEGHIPHHALFCMFRLHKSKRASMGELAQWLGVSNQQLTRIVNGLVEHGLAVRVQDESNRRLVLVEITPKGTEEVQKFMEIGFRHMASHLDVLTEEELDSCIYHLTELLKILGKMDSYKADRFL